MISNMYQISRDCKIFHSFYLTLYRIQHSYWDDCEGTLMFMEAYCKLLFVKIVYQQYFAFQSNLGQALYVKELESQKVHQVNRNYQLEFLMVHYNLMFVAVQSIFTGVSDRRLLYQSLYMQFLYYIQIFEQITSMYEDKGNKSSEDQLLEEEDEGVSEELEKSFRGTYLQERSTSSNSSVHNQEPFFDEVIKPIEMMFIIFSVYKEDIIIIASQNNCKVKIAMNKLRISSNQSQQKLQDFMRKIHEYLNKICYDELKLQGKYLFYQSPYFFQKSREMGFHMTKFNSKIYCHSNSLQIQKLKSTAKELFGGKKIFPIKFKSYKQKDHDIHDHLRNFIRIIITYHQANQFQDRNVTVELDRDENGINCLGQKQRDLLACKNMIKNVVHSTVAIIIRYNQVPDDFQGKIKKIKTYCQKISTFPIYVGKLTSKAVTLISKENILKSLMKKEKFKGQLALKSNTEIGLYFIKFPMNYSAKKNAIQEVCHKKGYDYTNLGGGGLYNFFRKIFLEEHEQVNIDGVVQILIQSLQKIREIKQKFDVPAVKMHYTHKNTNIFQVNQGQYYSTGEIIDHEQLSDILKCNVMKEKLKMSKGQLVKYKIDDGKQFDKIYWSIDSQTGIKLQCKIEQMKRGIQYFEGRKKVKEGGGQSEKLYFIENKIIIV